MSMSNIYSLNPANWFTGDPPGEKKVERAEKMAANLTYRGNIKQASLCFLQHTPNDDERRNRLIYHLKKRHVNIMPREYPSHINEK